MFPVESCRFIYSGEVPWPEESAEGQSSSSDRRASSSKKDSGSAASTGPASLAAAAVSLDNSALSLTAGDAKDAKGDGKSTGTGDAKSAGPSSAAQMQMLSARDPLFLAADRFQISDLVELCLQRLALTLAPDNLADRLILADTFHSAVLKQKCLQYLRAEPARLAAVMDSEGYARLTSANKDDLLTAFIPLNAKRAAGAKDS